MIQCDGCDTWFHGSCVRVIEDEAKLLNNYYCECNAINTALLLSL